MQILLNSSHVWTTASHKAKFSLQSFGSSPSTQNLHGYNQTQTLAYMPGMSKWNFRQAHQKNEEARRLATTATAPTRRSTTQAWDNVWLSSHRPAYRAARRGIFHKNKNTPAAIWWYTKFAPNQIGKYVSRLGIPGNIDVMENNIILNGLFNINIVSLYEDSKKYIQHSEYTEYTDGSKIDGKASAGW